MSKSGLKSNLSYFYEWGLNLGKRVRPGDIYALTGPMGVGKTTLVKAIVEGALNMSHCVTSPTFSLLNIYEGRFPIYHFDLYRLKEERDFILLGFEEYLVKGGVVCIEWSEKIASLLTQFPTKKISVSISEEGSRLIHYEAS